MMKKVAIDLTWVRPSKVGGTESCVRNLLDGFVELNSSDIRLYLLLTKDNADSFCKYKNYDCFELVYCDVNSASQKERVLWQNLKMGSVLRKMEIPVCLEPVYGKPFFGCHGIRFVTTIHDLQAKHYPQYFSKGRVLWMKASWKNAVKTSERIIAISSYVKKDIIETYNVPSEKVSVIYDAVALNLDECTPIEELNKYGVNPGEYYYTVSSLFLHKNLKTAILALAELKKRKSAAFRKLIISGIGGRKRDELDQLIAENGLTEDVVFTSFVDNAERNMLYKNCKAFIFTSVFEGFGMPPIEAMALGVPVLTSKSTSLAEVTGDLCSYVENPLDPIEWADKLECPLEVVSQNDVKRLISQYDKRVIAEKYIELFSKM